MTMLKRSLDRFIAHDQGSSELLSFGLHIHAVRRPPDAPIGSLAA
jgi:hypothetical protein